MAPSLTDIVTRSESAGLDVLEVNKGYPDHHLLFPLVVTIEKDGGSWRKQLYIKVAGGGASRLTATLIQENSDSQHPHYHTSGFCYGGDASGILSEAIAALTQLKLEQFVMLFAAIGAQYYPRSAYCELDSPPMKQCRCTDHSASVCTQCSITIDGRRVHFADVHIVDGELVPRLTVENPRCKVCDSSVSGGYFVLYKGFHICTSHTSAILAGDIEIDSSGNVIDRQETCPRCRFLRRPGLDRAMCSRVECYYDNNSSDEGESVASHDDDILEEEID